ncbi:glycine cleavage system aminomethyltransferase GcvT [bacterium]|nr:glycine cleavage system aminomethyltransferase GcvT [bacterium]
MAIKTALYDTHLLYGGKIVDFAGYELPIQYEKGILHEHETVRTKVGLFDVSHMGEILIEGPNAEKAVRTLVTNKISTMVSGQCRYALMCYESGGLVDDLLIYKYNTEKYLLVVNASNIEKDFAHMQNKLLSGATIKNISSELSQIAIQGRLAEKVLNKLTDMSKLPVKNYYFADNINVGGIICLVSTTGYTGEAGYELYCKNADAPKLYEMLMESGNEFGIEPIGLGARDTLRFEASMPLYGHELSKDTLAHEVSLDFFIKYDEDFIGRDSLLNNPPKFERKGIKLLDRGIAREHCDLYDKDGKIIGMTTSGGICPTIGGAYAMVRIIKGYEGEIFVDVRGRKLLAEIVPMPFYKRA